VTSQEAKETLLLYRPHVDDRDPEFAPALEIARKDPELKKWFEQHCAIQKAVFAGFDHIAVPDGFKEQILSEQPANASPARRGRGVLLLVTGIPVVLLVAFLMVYSQPPSATNFASFRLRMAGKVLRDYPKMDLETADLGKIRQYLAEHGGSKDYVLPAGLQKVAGTGCALFEWKGQKVSMVCFKSGKNARSKDPDLFLFIVDRGKIAQPASISGPELAAVKSLATASWTQGDKTYLLAGAGNQEFLREYY
jgi:hypothetical protein